MKDAEQIEVSLVIPCLNEADTLQACLEKAKQGLRACGTHTEIIVADNGSVDASPQIAEENGAIVVNVADRGYGNALIGGISKARGKFIIMGDADTSHDLTEIPKFVEKLRNGVDLAQGCRFPSGGGDITPGSMSFLRRRLGNPVFSWMVRKWFRVPVHDVNCGFRGFHRSLYERMDIQCTGMEFSPEMIVKAGFLGANIAEIPITHHPDGRVSQPAHNRTIRDGWRTLRFLLMYSPRWLFLIPGLLLIALGVSSYLFIVFAARPMSPQRFIQSVVFAGLSILCGYQSVLFAVFTKVFATQERLLARDERFESLFEVINLERTLLVSALSILAGVIFLAFGLAEVGVLIFDPLNSTFIGALAVAVGFQTVLSGFFLSILGLRRR
jgi:glycosyltransferase involved in cell wall biosynthesis